MKPFTKEEIQNAIFSVSLSIETKRRCFLIDTNQTLRDSWQKDITELEQRLSELEAMLEVPKV